MSKTSNNNNNNNLDATWILVECGNKKFAINSKFVSGIDELKQDKCIGASTKFNVRRGIYNILGLPIVVLDSRKIVGEPMVNSLKLDMSTKVQNIKNELIKWLDDAEWSLMSKSSIELNYKKLSLYEWLLEETGIKEIDVLKSKMLVSYKEAFILMEHAIETKKDYTKGMAEALKIHEGIRKLIDRSIIKPINRTITLYNNSISETCIVLKHKEFKYGIAVDDISAITERVTVRSSYSEYKPIAGKLIYGDNEYNIFNVTYLSNLANRFDASPIDDD